MRISMGVALAAFLLTGTAVAQGKSSEQAIKGSGRYGTAGCGLGSMAFGDAPGGVQVFAATTNSLFGTQTFGITTGTSNCGPGLMASGTRNYIDANREAVAKDISRGEGESIGALTWMNGCRDSRQVGAALQRNFGRIFPTTSASTEQVTGAVLETLRSDASLGCGKS